MLKSTNSSAVHYQHLLTPSALKSESPPSQRHLEFIQHTREEITRILTGESPRILLIVGPCSIHDSIAAKEYAIKLKHLSSYISNTFLIVMRTYFEKPRTLYGWKGMLYDPLLDGSNNLSTGLRACREILLQLAEMELPAGTEFLDPLSPLYFSDLISWGCIGARTAESQIHRQCASGLPMPVAFKNGTSGDIDVAINGALVAKKSHTFLGMNEEGTLSSIHTPGNKTPHIMLRGGKSAANYDPQSIARVLEIVKKTKLSQGVIVDCSHGNASHYEKQADTFQSLILQRLQGDHFIKGIAMEGHLFAGNQEPLLGAPLKYGVSITDPCLDWQTVEGLIHWAHTLLTKNEKSFPSREPFPSLYAQSEF